MSSHSNQPPLYFILLHWWTIFFGTGEIALRSLSVILGIIAVFICYLVGKELISPKVGLIGSFVSAISQFYIFHSQDTRAYALLLLLSLASYLFFIRISKQDNIQNYIWYFVANILLGYTHIYGLFIITSQMLYFVIFWNKYKQQRTRLLYTWIGTVVCLSPLVFLLGQNVVSIAGSGFWVPRPDLQSIFTTFFEYSSGFRIQELSSTGEASQYHGLVWAKYILLAFFLLLAVTGAFFAGRKINKQFKKKTRDRLQARTPQMVLELPNVNILLIIWLFVPILVPFIISQVITPIYLARYTIGASPAFYLLIAKGMSVAGKKTMLSLLLVIAVFSSFGLYDYYSIDIKEQWREVVGIISERAKQDDVLIFCKPYVQLPFDYYYKGDLEEFGVPENASAQDIAALVNNAIEGKSRLWLIVSNVSGLPPVVDYLKDNYSLVEWSGYRGIIVFLFDL